MKKRAITFVILALVSILSLSLFLLAGCGGNKTVKVDSFTLDCQTKAINVGESFKLKISESKYEGQVSFSSENSSVAIVTSNGLVTGIAEGSTKIFANLGKYSTFCTVTVADSSQSSIENFNVALSKKYEKLKVGNATVVSAIVFNGNVQTDNIVSWSVSDSERIQITVQENNLNSVLVTSIGCGNADLIATYGKFVAKCTFTIEEKVDFVFDKDQGKESSKISKNESKNIKPTIYDEDIKNESAVVTFESSNPNVVTVDDNGNIEGVNFGNAVIYITYEGTTFEYAVEVFDRIIYTNVKRLLFNKNGQKQYTFTLSSKEVELFGYPLNLSDVTSLFLVGSDDEYNVSVSEQSLTVNGLPFGDNEYYLYNGNTKFKLNLVVASVVISDYADLIAFRNKVSQGAVSGSMKHVMVEDYVCLLNDIDCNGNTYTSSASGNVFGGVLDGNGYQIKNINLSGSLLWAVSGTIKNLGISFTANVGNNQSFGALALEVRKNTVVNGGGIITDVFVEGKINGASVKNIGGIVSKTYNGTKIQSSFADITFNLSGANAKGVITAISEGTMSNCYAISNVQSLSATTGTNKNNVKTSYAEFISAKIALDNYGDTWDITCGVPLFVNYVNNVPEIEILNKQNEVAQEFYVLTNDNKVIYSIEGNTQGVQVDALGKVTFTSRDKFAFTVKVTSICDTEKCDSMQFVYAGGLIVNMLDSNSFKINKNDNDNFVMDISEFYAYESTFDVISLTIGENPATSITYFDGRITLSNEFVQTLPSGELIASIITDSKITYNFKVTVFREVVITTKAQFVDLFETLYESSNNEGDPLRIKLGADIVFNESDPVLKRNGAFTFYGELDGQGYSIKNLKIDTKTTASAGGLFGICYGDVKNIAFVNIAVDNGTRGNAFGVICSTLKASATISNVFVSGNTIVSGNNAGGLVWTNEGTVKNCIVVLETTATEAYSTLTCRTGIYATNCYGISSTYKRLIPGKTFSNNVDGFFASVTLLSATDGWSELWELENGSLSFGNNVVLTSKIL